MADRVYNVLFLCTGNSARSILAESLLRSNASGCFRAFSAGSRPKDTVNPMALQVLARAGLPTDGLSSKSWDTFAGGPAMDFVFTVCDQAVGEACPVWPGQPMTAHWGIEDPAAVDGSEIDRERAFVTALQYLKMRISLFTSLPLKSLDAMTLRSRLVEIGQAEGASSKRPDVA